MVYTYNYISPMGKITIAFNEESVVGLWFDGQKHFEAILPENHRVCYDKNCFPILLKTLEWLDIYFSGKCPDFTPQIAVKATPFRMRVWNIISEIPYGETLSYKEIARKTVKDTGFAKMSSQAVGGAVGHNPILLIIPCHRVIGADGSLTGYAAGTDRKMRLLSMEGADISEPGVLLRRQNL